MATVRKATSPPTPPPTPPWQSPHRRKDPRMDGRRSGRSPAPRRDGDSLGRVKPRLALQKPTLRKSLAPGQMAAIDLSRKRVVGGGAEARDPDLLCLRNYGPVPLAYQPPANSTFLSEQTSHQQPASSTFLSEQISTSHQPPAERTGYMSCVFFQPELEGWVYKVSYTWVSIYGLHRLYGPLTYIYTNTFRSLNYRCSGVQDCPTKKETHTQGPCSHN
jgi:hypothetical protein